MTLPKYIEENEKAIVKMAREILGPNPRPAIEDWQTARARAVKALRKEGRLKEYR